MAFSKFYKSDKFIMAKRRKSSTTFSFETLQEVDEELSNVDMEIKILKDI